jgi:hypothetical protein
LPPSIRPPPNRSRWSTHASRGWRSCRRCRYGATCEKGEGLQVDPASEDLITESDQGSSRSGEIEAVDRGRGGKRGLFTRFFFTYDVRQVCFMYARFV